MYTHYNIERKLYYAPLWYSLYFAGYVLVQLCKHAWRHRYTFPQRVEDALATGRAADDAHREALADTVTKAISKVADKLKAA